MTNLSFLLLNRPGVVCFTVDDGGGGQELLQRQVAEIALALLKCEQAAFRFDHLKFGLQPPLIIGGGFIFSLDKLRFQNGQSRGAVDTRSPAVNISKLSFFRNPLTGLNLGF